MSAIGISRAAGAEGETRRMTVIGARETKPSSAVDLRVLLVEDSLEDAGIVRSQLEDIHGDRCELRVVRRLDEVADTLGQFAADCVLLDLSLPDSTGLDGVAFLLSGQSRVPIIVLTGIDRRETAIDAVRSGAQDYLVKGKVDAELLSRSIHYAIERKRAELQLVYQGLHDAVTQLPNRILFTDRLRHALAKQGRTGHAVAVMFLDLDRFKGVNDQFGHAAGDELLVEVARRLQSLLRPNDTVARLGGDEFAIICEDFDSETEAADIAGRVVESIRPAFTLSGKEAFVSTSVGVALAIESSDPAALIHSADLALYRAKDKGRGRFEFFDDAMRERAVNRAELQNALHRAVEDEEFRLVYQPLVELATGKLVGAEALVRWIHPRRGTLEPDEFIPVAEEMGLIVPIGALVLREACKEAARWNDGTTTMPRLSINISARQFAHPGVAQQVEAALAETKLDPSLVCLEITESAVMTDIPGMRIILHNLKDLGVGLAIDDFGTGYSSLSLLHRFPFDQLKIDRSFVARLGRDPHASDFVAAIIGLAKALRLSCVAEGIETPDQLSILRELDCELGQGFYFSHPLSKDDFRRGELGWLPAPR